MTEEQKFDGQSFADILQRMIDDARFAEEFKNMVDQACTNEGAFRELMSLFARDAAELERLMLAPNKYANPMWTGREEDKPLTSTGANG